MIRISRASEKLRLATCAGLLGALTACAMPARTSSVAPTDATPVNVSLRSEAELRSRAESVFARLIRANADVCRPFVVRQATGDWQCDQRLVVSNDNAVNAFAKPNVVTVSIGMLRFLRGDDDLAFILAHEMSHNLIEQAGWREAGGGRIRADLVAMRSDSVREMEPQPVHSGDVETAADYLGVYLAARAGFAMDKASLLMRSLSALDPQSPIPGDAQPLIVWRYLAVEQAMREIAAKQTKGMPLIPTRQ
jgi:hypothetical protein